MQVQPAKEDKQDDQDGLMSQVDKERISAHGKEGLDERGEGEVGQLHPPAVSPVEKAS